VKSKLFAFIFVSLSMLTTGCAIGNKMAFEGDSDRITEASKPIYLMTVSMSNAYKTSFQPSLKLVHIEKAGSSVTELNGFATDKKSEPADKDGKYLVRMELSPGEYVLQGLRASAFVLPIFAQYYAPVHAPIQVQGRGVYYLGHVSATVRERTGNEFKAGMTTPLLDQAVGGASGGTFDIVISDQFSTDEALFRSKFPALKDVIIQKAILPPFDRAKAQKMWEASSVFGR
jgi:hypothetical protein